jgi:hypothetical protein
MYASRTQDASHETLVVTRLLPYPITSSSVESCLYNTRNASLFPNSSLNEQVPQTSLTPWFCWCPVLVQTRAQEASVLRAQAAIDQVAVLAFAGGNVLAAGCALFNFEG